MTDVQRLENAVSVARGDLEQPAHPGIDPAAFVEHMNVNALVAANVQLREERDRALDRAHEQWAAATTLSERVARLEREAQVLYEMLCKSNELAGESNRVTRAQVERAQALRKERFGV